MNETDRLQRLGRENACEGVRYEPRVYWERLEFVSGTREVTAGDLVFRNGEESPVRITHMTMAMRPFIDGSSPPDSPLQGDERLVQNYSMRIRAHDTYYQTERFLPLPLWHNVVVAGAESITQGSSSWRFNFPKPFTLGQRDTMTIDAVLEVTPAGDLPVAVAFDGVGKLSRRPYRLAGTIDLGNTIRQSLPVDSFRNEGAEPIEIHSMAVRCSSPLDSASPAGDIRQLKVAVKQTGNGSQRAWFRGPNNPGPPDLCPASLLGLETGRAIVHRLPQNGWLWQPGQGLDLEMISRDTSRLSTEVVYVAMVGYRIIT